MGGARRVVLMSLRVYLRLALVVPALAGVAAEEAQFQQARQFGAFGNLPANAPSATISQTLTPSAGEDSDSFGVQQFLKDQEKLKMFRVYSDITALVTNNAALTRHDARTDAFLTQTFGFELRRPLAQGWQLEAGLQYSLFRYDKFRVLDFNSADADIGLLYHADRLGGVDFFLRYDFTALSQPSNGDPFLHSHTGIFGVQKSIAFNPAAGMFFGLSAEKSATRPRTEERSEFALFGGFQVQPTRHLQADLTYRWSLIPYTDFGRTDENQILSLGLHYHFSEWISAFTSVYADWNWSNKAAFSYSDVKGGCGLGLELRF